MRTTRTRPPGRHRSPDRLSVPPDAPALVLAVPGAVTESSIEIATGSDGSTIALFPNAWRLKTIKRDHPELALTGLGIDGA